LQGSRLFHRSFLSQGKEGRGKSGQRRAPCFLTGRYPRGYSSVTENDRPSVVEGKGENVRQELTGSDGDIRSSTPHGLKDHVYRLLGLLVRCRGVGRMIVAAMQRQDK
jgi:hypothetical protein